MRISISRECLLANLNAIACGLPVKTPMPSLTGVLVDVREGKCQLTSSSSDIAVRTTIVVSDNLSIAEEGRVLVQGKMFIDMMKKLSAKTVELNTSEGMLHINCGKCKYKLKLMNEESYPAVEFGVTDNSVNVNTQSFCEMVKRSSFAASQTEKRPILTGVNFRNTDGVMKVTATDSFRLSQSSYSVADAQEFNITIPSKSLNEMIKCIGSLDDTMSLQFNHNRLYSRFDNVEFQTILLDGNYPDIDKIIPTSFIAQPRFNTQELLESLDRVALLVPADKVTDKEVSYAVAKLSIENGQVTLTSNNNVLGSAFEEITCLNDVSGVDPININFSAKYMVDALKSFKSGEVTFNITSDVRPFTIVGANEQEMLQLILPVRC